MKGDTNNNRNESLGGCLRGERRRRRRASDVLVFHGSLFLSLLPMSAVVHALLSWTNRGLEERAGGGGKKGGVTRTAVASTDE